jgi:sirohydrochlorin ferrochelatase
MTVALIDNGSLEPAAHRNLRRIAAALSERTGVPVHAVSWKHSDRIRPDVLGGKPAWTLAAWVKAQLEAGERDLVFVPFFISAQGAIGSALRQDLERLQREIGAFKFVFTPGLAAHGVLSRIVTARIEEAMTRTGLHRPPVILVDHGGPSPASAALRNHVAQEVRQALGGQVREVVAASMEGAEYAHNYPLFADVLAGGGFDHGDILVAPLFLSPGRHAGPRGDLAEIATAAEDRLSATPLRCHFADLVGTHPDVITALTEALSQTLTTLSVAA